MHHSGHYLVSLIFGTTIPTSFNILVKCFFTLYTHTLYRVMQVAHKYSCRPGYYFELDGSVRRPVAMPICSTYGGTVWIYMYMHRHYSTCAMHGVMYVHVHAYLVSINH